MISPKRRAPARRIDRRIRERDRIPMPSPRILWLILLMILASPAWGGDFPADHLLIQVQIDGTDELHISPRRIWWTHKARSAPAEVQINGFRWDLRQSPVLWLPAPNRFFPHDLDLCGAVMHKLRGAAPPGSAPTATDWSCILMILTTARTRMR